MVIASYTLPVGSSITVLLYVIVFTGAFVFLNPSL
jgi:hypothetical protein